MMKSGHGYDKSNFTHTLVYKVNIKVEELKVTYIFYTAVTLPRRHGCFPLR